jgi:excisionase family DNA binding protein
MKTLHFQIGLTLDSDAATALIELVQQGVEKGTAQLVQKRTSPLGTTEPDLERKPKPTPLERSQHALFGGQKPPDNVGLLINTREAAKLLKVSERTLWNLWKGGRMPKPIRIGQAVRFSYEELRAWVNAGGPPQDEWKYSPGSQISSP